MADTPPESGEKRAAVLTEQHHGDQDGSSHGWLTSLKTTVLAKAPLQSAPLEYGGHRVAEEPHAGRRGLVSALAKFARFFGPGMILTVAYIDPDNFQSSFGDGQDYGYLMICIVWFSLVVAIYLQYLCLRMATVTGLNLAQMNHKHMPRWLELIVYAVAEAVCICTDISAVLGAAFAWNLLIPNLPLPAACVITVADALIILLFYSPTGNLRSIRSFELFIGAIVMTIFIITAVIFAQVQPVPPPGPVWRGFLPSREIFVGQGLYDTAGMIGGMLMPHALYVGSAIAQPRLLEYDAKHHLTTFKQGEAPIDVFYRPSLRAIKSTLTYATIDLCTAIFCIGLFVNAAPEIISAAAFGATSSSSSSSSSDDDDSDGGGGSDRRRRRDDDDDSSSGGSGPAVSTGSANDLSDLYGLFQTNISQSAATLFAVAFLLSGVAAGIVSTMAGQTVMEGAFAIKINPFVRRLITRCIAIIPALIVCVSVGQDGIGNALTACNYVLAIGLVFVLLPVVWYTTHDKYMMVPSDDGQGFVSMRIGLVATVFAWAIWALVIFTDIATIVLLGLGLAD